MIEHKTTGVLATHKRKIYGSQKELRLQKLHIVQTSIQDPNMNLTQ